MPSMQSKSIKTASTIIRFASNLWPLMTLPIKPEMEL